MKISRPWVKLHTAVLADEEFLDLSCEAKVCYLAGLAKAGMDSTDGVIPCQPKSVVRWTGLDITQAKAAVDELSAVGFWEIAGPCAKIRNWGKYQPLIEELDAKRTAATERLVRFREKKRAEKSTATSIESNELDAAGVCSKLWDAISSAVRDEMDQQSAVAIYRKLYEQAVEAGSDGGKYVDVKGIGAATLANQVINHAALRWLGIEPNSPQLRRLHALRKDHGPALLDLLPLAATSAKGDPISYLTSMLRKGVTR
jgi:hypothetical protein